MKICILVNGRKNGIFGRRAQQFCRYTPSLKNAVIFYRDDARKFFSMFFFVSNLIRIRPQLVYVEAVAFSGCIAAAFLKPILHFRYIISAGDDYYHIIKQLYGSFWGFFAGILEQLTYSIADAIITSSPYHREYLILKGYKRVFFISQGVDAEIFKPFAVNRLKQRLGLEGFLIIGLVGSITWHKKYNYSYGWEIIEIIRTLKERAVKGLIVGDGNGLAQLKKQAKIYGVLERIIFTGWVSYDGVPLYINCMDICFSTQSNNMVGKMRTPTKLGEYLTCGKFVISTDVGYAQLLLKEIGALIPYKGVRDDSYPIRAAKTIEAILSDESILDKAKRGIDIAKGKFDFKNLSKQLEEVITTVQETINP